MADLIITVTIDDTDQKSMKNDLLDLNAWVQDAVTVEEVLIAGKYFRQEWTTKPE